MPQAVLVDRDVPVGLRHKKQRLIRVPLDGHVHGGGVLGLGQADVGHVGSFAKGAEDVVERGRLESHGEIRQREKTLNLLFLSARRVELCTDRERAERDQSQQG